MAEIRWKPNVTVAAYIEHEGKLLWVREHTSRDGIPCGLISIPLRYMHSPVETISLADAKNAARLAAGFIRSLEKSDTFRVLD
jgi:hypothetical protein